MSRPALIKEEVHRSALVGRTVALMFSVTAHNGDSSDEWATEVGVQGLSTTAEEAGSNTEEKQ